jgi:WD40 repeat protein
MQSFSHVLLIFIFSITSVFAQQKPKLMLPISHTTSGNIISYSNNNQYLLTGADDKTVKIWEVSSGRLLHDLKGHEGGIVSAKFSTDDQFVLTAGNAGPYDSKDKYARLWSVSTGELVKTFEHNDNVNFATFSHKGKLIATSSLDLTVKIWDPLSGKLLFQLEPKADIKKVVFSPDDKLIATASHGKIILWDAVSGKLIKSISTFSTQDIEFSQDGKSIIETESYTKDRTNKHSILIWDLETGSVIKTLKTKGDPIINMSISTDGKYLAASDYKITVVWDLTFARVYKTLDEAHAVIFDKTNNYLIGNGKVYDLKTWKVVSKFEGHITGGGTFIKSALSNQISSDNIYIACFKGAHGDIVISNFLTGKIFRKITSHSSSVNCLALSSEGNLIAFGSFGDSKIKIINGNTGKFVTKIKNDDFISLSHLCFSKDETKIIICDQKTYIYESQTGKLINSYPKGEFRTTYAVTSPDDKLLITESNNEFKAWDLLSGKELYVLKGSFYMGNARFSKDGSYIAVPTSRGNILILESSTGKNIMTLNISVGYFKDCSFNADGKFLLAADDNGLGYIFNLETGKNIRQLTKHKADIYTCRFSEDGKYIITTDANGEAIVWDAYDATTEVEKPWKDTSAKVIAKFTLEKHAYKYNSSFSFNKNWMAINANNEIVVYNLHTMKKTFAWVGIDDEDYIIYTPNNYYTATPNAVRWVNWKIGSTLYDFDQWDIKYNRPDLILKAFQNKDTALIRAYETSYRKRLKKLDLDSAMFLDDYKVPEIIIPKSRSSNGQFEKKLKIIAKETSRNTYLRKIYVTVNGNPVYGKNGYDIPNKKSTQITLEIDLPLNSGDNQIKISCLNNRGAESLRKKININYEPSQKPNPKVWFIGIGVSKYKNEKYNLNYAVKDINDISELLKSKYLTYEPILLLNEKATRENVMLINKRLLEETKPDDIVIVSLSGHGLLDKDFNFYFATHDIDFDNPSFIGLSYDDIELLLDKVIASKKLVMMDACHSGELDADESEIQSVQIANKNVISVPKGSLLINKKSNLSTTSSYELLQELFTSTNSSNGATVISAAAGNEYAYEGQNWNNGVFTYCVLSSMKEKKGDLDGDGEVSVSELQKQVSMEVNVLTNGKQKPTTRQINFENDWIIWE